MKIIYWLRTDLRILDNKTLAECLRKNQETIFVFPQTKSLKLAGKIRKKFVEDSFNLFKTQLEENGFTVLKTELCFPDYISNLWQSHPFDSLYYTQEYAWDERIEENLVKKFCHEKNITVHHYDQGTLIALNDLPFTLNAMPFVFTDFRKKIELQLKIQPLISAPAPFTSFENQGTNRIKHYLWKTHAIQHYKETRNGMIRYDDSSKLSPWLNVGYLSARTIYYELKKYESEVCENESTYWLFFELLWRDYFKFFSLKFGQKIFLTSGLNPGVSPNHKLQETFLSWCEAKTPDTFINANMNELNRTGWMSNRGRQNVASYLIHDLGVDWTWGAAYFEEKLFDYDPDLNWGNWLYLSGRGSDPRARKFNTMKQAETYDPKGEYRQLWSSRKE
ncbi:MAG: FAD-binding domain-containing protein [Bacteriovoracaceae bacterium]|nr:FAD-binding domain-containing protein [Bacteriovoracaceae bacterium]